MKLMLLDLALAGSIRAKPRRIAMRGLIVLMLAGFASITQGGTITSGQFVFCCGQATATVSGQNFTATIQDGNAGDFVDFGLPPFQAHIPALSWGPFLGGPPSGVTYNGIFYGVPGPLGPAPGQSYASDFFAETPTSLPTITGPGTYTVTFSVSLDFALFDYSHTMFYSEHDTGVAVGTIDYNAGVGTNLLLSSHTLQGTVVPEPSTLSCIAFAVCCLGAALRKTRIGLRSEVYRSDHRD